MNAVTATITPTQYTAETLARQYIAGADTANGRRCRRQVVTAFTTSFGDLGGWRAAPVAEQLAASLPVRGFAAWAAVVTGIAVDATYVAAAGSKWGLFVADKYPQTAVGFRAEAASLGFEDLEIDKM